MPQTTRYELVRIQQSKTGIPVLSDLFGERKTVYACTIVVNIMSGESKVGQEKDNEVVVTVSRADTDAISTATREKLKELGYPDPIKSVQESWAVLDEFNQGQKK